MRLMQCNAMGSVIKRTSVAICMIHLSVEDVFQLHKSFTQQKKLRAVKQVNKFHSFLSPSTFYRLMLRFKVFDHNPTSQLDYLSAH